jgi:hypothetical protein
MLKSLSETKTNFALFLAKMPTLLIGFQQKCKEYDIAENIYFYDSKMGEK